jgi:hypothetical protein
MKMISKNGLKVELYSFVFEAIYEQKIREKCRHKGFFRTDYSAFPKYSRNVLQLLNQKRIKTEYSWVIR